MYTRSFTLVVPGTHEACLLTVRTFMKLKHLQILGLLMPHMYVHCAINYIKKTEFLFN